MNLFFRGVLFITMTTALFFGFLHDPAGAFPFERLHVFLFNLSSGGTVILAYTCRERGFSPRSAAFFVLSLLYAAAAFFSIWPAAVAAALSMAVINEKARAARFSCWPGIFFNGKAPVSEKFHAASLLCLSMALVLSAAVILNNEYLHLVVARKLTIDVFFLGFSFPVSLMTMSLMFSLMTATPRPAARAAMHFSFWTVNVGVIVFFAFILAEMKTAELAAAGILFAAVIVIFALHRSLAGDTQQGFLLSSGMGFLVMTAVTGITYIIVPASSPASPVILKIHAFASLYGWNLSGLAVMARGGDFPLRLHTGFTIALHWGGVFVLAPLGVYFGPAPASAALAAYAMFLSLVFFTGKK